MVSDPKVLYKGKKFQLEVDGERATINHPGAAVILPLIDPEHFVIIQVERPSVKETLWELPAGTLEEGEFPLTCAKRELAEETGYTAKNIKELFSFYASPGYSTEKLTAFLATDLKKGKQKLEKDENIEVQIISFTDAIKMIKENKIVDGKTIATLLHYFLY